MLLCVEVKMCFCVIPHSSSSSDYLQDSIIPTMHFQRSLPRLPIPKLPDTCNRYLASQEPVLSPEVFAATEKLVREFEKGEGVGKEGQPHHQFNKLNIATVHLNIHVKKESLKDRRRHIKFMKKQSKNIKCLMQNMYLSILSVFHVRNSLNQQKKDWKSWAPLYKSCIRSESRKNQTQILNGRF